MNTDAMNASACFTATFIKYRVPVKSTEYRTYPADLDFARSQVSYEINRQSRTMRHLDLQLIVGRRNEVGLTATAFKAGCRRHRLMQLLGTGCSICGAGALRTSRRAAGARCALSSQIGSDRDRDGASRGGDGAIPIGRGRTSELRRYWWNRWGLRDGVRGGVNLCIPA